MIRRTTDEILARIDQSNDFFGTEQADLLMALPFEATKGRIKDGISEEAWTKAQVTNPAELVLNYLPFAWDKANNCRGLSSMRSMYHFQSWLWLMGIDVEAMNLTDYEMYGKPQLVTISVAVGFDWYAHDEGGWVNEEGGPDLKTAVAVTFAMAEGLSLKAELEALDR